MNSNQNSGQGQRGQQAQGNQGQQQQRTTQIQGTPDQERSNAGQQGSFDKDVPRTPQGGQRVQGSQGQQQKGAPGGGRIEKPADPNVVHPLKRDDLSDEDLDAREDR